MWVRGGKQARERVYTIIKKERLSRRVRADMGNCREGQGGTGGRKGKGESNVIIF